MSLSEMAAAALAAAKNDPGRAATKLVEKAASDAELREKLLSLGASQIIRNHLRDGRQGVATAAQPHWWREPTPSGDVSKSVRAALFMEQRTLFGGTIRLADATREDLVKSAQSYEAQIRALQANASFERDIAERLPEGKAVRDVFTDPKVKEIARKHGVLKSIERHVA